MAKGKVRLSNYIEWYVVHVLGFSDFNSSDHEWSEDVREALESIKANVEVEVDSSIFTK